MASQEQFIKALAKPYDRLLFAKDVLKPVFGSNFTLEQELRPTSEEPTKTEKQSIKSVGKYGQITLDDGRTVACYEIELQPSVQIEQSKVTIQQYVRKLLTAGQAALVNFISPEPKEKNIWRFTLVAKDTQITEEGIKEKLTHAKRYTYLVEVNRPNRTLAERLEILESAKDQNLKALIEAFSVEKLSDRFFKEYKEHYQNYVEYLTGKRMVKEKGKWIEKKTGEPSAFLKSVFNGNEKAARDFCKKLMGRLVFLYFVQRKRWLGATNQQYKDGDPDFIFNLFQSSGGNDSFYPNWLSPLFFDTLNNNQRKNEEYKLPDSTIVHIPFLNGGLFDKDKVDEKRLTFPAHLFHNSKNPDSPKERGFLDFLNAFNFTVYEDSPDDHTVAVDPEMLGHIFENLLEENKEKGAFYTPKEIVHYMCRESLIEYLTTHLEKEYTVFKEVGDQQVQLFGNDGKTGQLNMMEKLGDEALNKADVERIVKEKDIAGLTNEQILRIDNLLDSVKICDPAIGSGAFPMGLLQEIFSIKEIIAYELELVWKPADVKENIIQRSIYGVDIERGAVDIARLRFWLSLLVDSEDPKPLPNLEYKIVVGNSLISMFEEEPLEIDWEIKEGSQSNMFGHDELLKRQELLKRITETQRAYFHADAQKKRALALQIRNQKIDLLMNQLSLMIQTKGEENKPAGSGKKAKERMERWLDTQNWKRMIQMLKNLREHPEKPVNHFDWKLDFPEVLNEQVADNEGFDIVIGNPPYIGEKGNSMVFEELKKIPKWKSFYRRRSNTYYFFIKKGIELLNNEGVQCLITPREFTNADWANKVRKVITDKTQVLKLIDFIDVRVFEEVGTSSFIILHKACEQRKNYKFQFKLIESDLSGLSNKFDYSEKESSLLGITGEKLWQFSQTEIKTDENVVKLNTIYDVSQGIITGADKVTRRHINKGYIDESYLNRGIFILKPNIDYRNVNEKFEIKIHQSWRELNSEDFTFIKPFVKTENLKKWKTTESQIKLLYVGKASLTKNIKDYLEQFSTVLLNRSTTVADDRLINLEEFKTFDKKTIKNNYSSAGAVQRVMRSKKWYLPFYERETVPFESDKIIFNTKNMDVFCFSDMPAYSTGGGGGGQTFIFPNNSDYWSNVEENSSIKEYLLFTNAVLNSNRIQSFISASNYNQLSTKKVGEIPIPKIDFSDSKEIELYNLVLNEVNKIIDGTGNEEIIDLLVYKLYNLTLEEVKVVDPEFELSVEEYERAQFSTNTNSNN